MKEGRPSTSPGLAILCMVGSCAVGVTSDAVTKWMTSTYPIGQILFVRNIFVFVPILLLVWRSGGFSVLRIHNIGTNLTRAVLMASGTFMFILGLKLLPLAVMIAIGFTGPLLLTALAGPMLGEHVGWRRWSAVIVGFFGVLLMTRPGAGVFQWAILVPIVSAILGTLKDVVTRSLVATETPLAIMTFTTVVIIAAGASTVVLGWEPITVVDVALLAVAGILVGTSHYLQIEAFRLAQVALVAPFRYSTLVWGIGLGFLVFGELPDGWTIAGSGVVVASGLYIMHREAVRGLRTNAESAKHRRL